MIPIRITLLGSAKVGKTSIASGFVNNFVPQIYTPSEQQPTYYYKTLDHKHEVTHPHTGRSTTVIMPVLAEVEDTFAWSAASDPKRKTVVNPRPKQQERVRSLAAAGTAAITPDAELLKPFALVSKPPAIAHRRMAFMVLFDPNDEQTWNEAKQAALKVKEADEAAAGSTGHAESHIVLMLVACKMDKGLSVEAEKIIREAKAFAASLPPSLQCKLEQLSILDLCEVRKLFKKTIGAVIRQKDLWTETAKEANEAAADAERFHAHAPTADGNIDVTRVFQSQAPASSSEQNCALQ